MELSKRKKQKQLWVDKEFIRWLKRMKAKKELSGEEISNLGELTRQIVNTPAIQDIEKQLSTELAPCLELESVSNVRVLGAIGVVEMKQAVDMKQIQNAVGSLLVRTTHPTFNNLTK